MAEDIIDEQKQQRFNSILLNFIQKNQHILINPSTVNNLNNNIISKAWLTINEIELEIDEALSHFPFLGDSFQKDLVLINNKKLILTFNNYEDAERAASSYDKKIGDVIISKTDPLSKPIEQAILVKKLKITINTQDIKDVLEKKGIKTKHISINTSSSGRRVAFVKVDDPNQLKQFFKNHSSIKIKDTSYNVELSHPKELTLCVNLPIILNGMITEDQLLNELLKSKINVIGVVIPRTLENKLRNIAYIHFSDILSVELAVKKFINIPGTNAKAIIARPPWYQ